MIASKHQSSIHQSYYQPHQPAFKINMKSEVVFESPGEYWRMACKNCNHPFDRNDRSKIKGETIKILSNHEKGRSQSREETSELLEIKEKSLEDKLRIPLVLMCGHTICQICYYQKMSVEPQYYCIECGADLKTQFQFKPPVNLDLHQVSSQVTLGEDEYKWRYISYRHQQEQMQNKLKVSPQEKCLNEWCYNRRFKKCNNQLQWFCSKKCQMIYQEQLEESTNNAVEIIQRHQRSFY